ncbi:MAG: TRAP transporter small permease [Microvirga sp.]|nr:TRAP transporter small permease [Microvirga sp.]
MSDERDPADRPHVPDTGADHVVVPVKIEEALGAAAMAAICLISFGNVLARYFTNVSFAFTEEFSVFLLAFMTFVGASAAFATNEHIRITFLVDRLNPTWRFVCEMIALLATTIMFSLIVYYGGKVTYDEWYWRETSPGLGNPTWLYTIWLPLLSVAIILRVIGRAWAKTIRPRLRAGRV